MKKTSVAMLMFALVCLAIGTAGATGTTGVLGQLALNDALIDGTRSPAGTTVMSPSRVQTEGAPSVVHLSSGGRVYLGPNSVAQLESTDAGDVQVAADAGMVQIGNTQGEVMTLAYNTLAVFDQEGGVEVDPEQRACVLAASGDNSPEDCEATPTLDGCDWEETKTGELQTGDVYFVPVADAACEPRRGVPVWVWGAVGVAGAVVLADELDDDGDQPVSPFQP